MNREEYIYYTFMKKVTEDDFISLDESGLILILEDKLGLSDDRMDEIMGWIEEGGSPLDDEGTRTLANDTSNHLQELSIYESILREALKDEAVHRDEKDLIIALTSIMNISEEERSKIYDSILSGS
ncbi:MAG: hypothetical protein JXA22_10430 [Candidatus Thermoplasmatota archaeon]|nr:hypothetical protein [Candidatus Thermoplasmatota archaeon]